MIIVKSFINHWRENWLEIILSTALATIATDIIRMVVKTVETW